MEMKAAMLYSSKQNDSYFAIGLTQFIRFLFWITFALWSVAYYGVMTNDAFNLKTILPQIIGVKIDLFYIFTIFNAAVVSCALIDFFIVFSAFNTFESDYIHRFHRLAQKCSFLVSQCHVILIAVLIGTLSAVYYNDVNFLRKLSLCSKFFFPLILPLFFLLNTLLLIRLLYVKHKIIFIKALDVPNLSYSDIVLSKRISQLNPSHPKLIDVSNTLYKTIEYTEMRGIGINLNANMNTQTQLANLSDAFTPGDPRLLNEMVEDIDHSSETASSDTDDNNISNLNLINNIKCQGLNVLQRFFQDKLNAQLSIFLLTWIVLALIPFFVAMHSPCFHYKLRLPPDSKFNLVSLPHSKPNLIAHRGGISHFTENTALAMVQGISDGCHSLETDGQISSDYIPFIFHDATLLRMQNSHLSISIAKSSVNLLPFDYIFEHARLHGSKPVATEDCSMYYHWSNTYLDINSKINLDHLMACFYDRIIPFDFFLNLVSILQVNFRMDMRCPHISLDSFGNCTKVYLDLFQEKYFSIQKFVWWKDLNIHFATRFIPDAIFVQTLTSPQIVEVGANTDSLDLDWGLLNEASFINQLHDYILGTWVIDSKWAFSCAWCLGFHTVTTNQCKKLSAMQRPLYVLPLWMYIDILLALTFLCTSTLLFLLNLYLRDATPFSVCKLPSDV